MRLPTTAITRTLRADLLYLYYSRAILGIGLFMAAGATVAFTGSVSAAQSSHKAFLQQVDTFERNGISLEDALAAPMTVTVEDGRETIDNPLKYDYLQVGESVRAVDGVVPFVGTALDLVTFIVIPLVMIALGLHVATVDRRAGTIKLRASRDRWADLVVAKLLALLTASVLATFCTVLAAATIALLGSPLTAAATGDINYALVTPESTSPLLAKLALTTLVAMLFGLVGFATGAVVGTTSWPLAMYGLALFLLPFASPWDPRNLLASIGANVYDFWGQFELRPPLPIDAAAAAVGLGVCAFVALVLATAFPLRSRRYR